MTDLSATIVPKSDQLNADDLIVGPRTIEITRVSVASADQPVSIYFKGDDGKPYKPCKSMRRVLVMLWGADSTAYTGRTMTLYRDNEVRFGSDEVGGIRISHMSHIDRDMTVSLTATRGKKKPHTVRRLESSKPQGMGPDALRQAVEAIGNAAPEALEGIKVALREKPWNGDEKRAIKAAIEARESK